MEITPDIKHHIASGVYIREMRLARAGATIVTHRHHYDHWAILGAGTVELTIDGARQEVTGPAAILITAHRAHMVIAITPVVWFCVHAIPPGMRDEDVVGGIDEVIVSGVRSGGQHE